MTPALICLALFALMLVLMAARVPVAAAMFVAGTVGYVAQAGWGNYLNLLGGAAYARFSVYDLSVIPLFLLMGQFATQGGLSRALFAFAHVLVGRVRGGMAVASLLACAGFGAVCGSSVATAATLSTVALPEMRRAGYSGGIATATLAVGGTLGILIPPSVVLVVYGILTEQNIASLFAAAFIPGIVTTLGYCVAISLYLRLVPGHAPPSERPAAGQVGQALRDVAPIGVIFLLVFGGIYGGFFTPTEAAAVGAAGTFLVALAKRELDLPAIRRCFLSTAEVCGFIFLIFLGADMLNAALALTDVSRSLAGAVVGLGLPPLVVVGGILLFYVVLGSVMDELSMIILTVPIFFPILLALDLPLSPTEKAIWFGILVLTVVEVGLIAPPVGLNVYVVNGLARDVPMAESYRGVLPYLAWDLLRALLLLAFPSISLAGFWLLT